MTDRLYSKKLILVIFCLLVTVSTGTMNGKAESCLDDEVVICGEVSRVCQTTYDSFGNRDFECLCQYPFLEKNGDCIYVPGSHHFKLKMELTDIYPMNDVNGVISYGRLQKDIKELLKGIFPDSTIDVINLRRKEGSLSFLEKSRTKTINVEARLSHSELSKHTIQQTLKNSCSSACETKMFSFAFHADNVEIEFLDEAECSVCGQNHVCNPQGSTLCTCKENSTDCSDLPMPLHFQMVKETNKDDELTISDAQSDFDESDELERMLKGSKTYQPQCLRYHHKLCQLVNGACVPNLYKDLSCDCKENFIMSKSGTCLSIQDIDESVNIATFLLRNDAPWYDDLADKTSYRYLRLKKSALKFLKIVFPDARASILNIAPTDRIQRGLTGSQVQMKILLSSDITSYDKTAISLRLKLFLVSGSDDVTVPGFSFSIYSTVISEAMKTTDGYYTSEAPTTAIISTTTSTTSYSPSTSQPSTGTYYPTTTHSSTFPSDPPCFVSPRLCRTTTTTTTPTYPPTEIYPPTTTYYSTTTYPPTTTYSPTTTYPSNKPYPPTATNYPTTSNPTTSFQPSSPSYPLSTAYPPTTTYAPTATSSTTSSQPSSPIYPPTTTYPPTTDYPSTSSQSSTPSYPTTTNYPRTTTCLPTMLPIPGACTYISTTTSGSSTGDYISKTSYLPSETYPTTAISVPTETNPPTITYHPTAPPTPGTTQPPKLIYILPQQILPDIFGLRRPIGLQTLLNLISQLNPQQQLSLQPQLGFPLIFIVPQQISLPSQINVQLPHSVLPQYGLKQQLSLLPYLSFPRKNKIQS